MNLFLNGTKYVSMKYLSFKQKSFLFYGNADVWHAQFLKLLHLENPGSFLLFFHYYFKMIKYVRQYFFALIYTEVCIVSRSGQQWCAKQREVHKGGENFFFQPASLVSDENRRIETVLHNKPKKKR